MPRPRKTRLIETTTPPRLFKPCAGRSVSKNSVTLYLDELEAMRLADLEGMSQEDAAARMDISRSTFARLINDAHRKIAEALLTAKIIAVEGGAPEESEESVFKCAECEHEWKATEGRGCADKCPLCKGTNCGLRYQRQDGCGGSAAREGAAALCCENRKDCESSLHNNSRKKGE